MTARALRNLVSAGILFVASTAHVGAVAPETLAATARMLGVEGLTYGSSEEEGGIVTLRDVRGEVGTAAGALDGKGPRRIVVRTVRAEFAGRRGDVPSTLAFENLSSAEVNVGAGHVSGIDPDADGTTAPPYASLQLRKVQVRRNGTRAAVEAVDVTNSGGPDAVTRSAAKLRGITVPGMAVPPAMNALGLDPTSGIDVDVSTYFDAKAGTSGLDDLTVDLAGAGRDG